MPRHLAILSLLAAFLAAVTLLPPADHDESAHAAGSSAAPTPVIPPPHFRLPFDTLPGVSTWVVSQFYGNTPFAYSLRNALYVGSQGLHSGVDFAARCGTPVVAIGDGQVVEIDNSAFGLVPHMLAILHSDGYVSFYGHLLEKPKLDIGDEVKAGQPIALTGDPGLTCHTQPHLHLEIRDRHYIYAYDPVDLIDADWNSLALFGPYEAFARDQDNPGRWVSPFDQPDLRFGGPLLNDYAHPWPPPDW